MAEELRKSINWEAEIQKSIDKNRLILDKNTKEIQEKIDNLYNTTFIGINNDTNKLFNIASSKGKWTRSAVIKYNRNINLMTSIKDRLGNLNKELKKELRKHIRNTTTAEFREVQELLNDYQLTDISKFLSPKASGILDKVFAMEIQGLTYLQRVNKITIAESIRIEEEIKLSQALGENYNKTANRILKVANIGKQSARRLAHMSTMQASNMVHIDTYKKSKVTKGWKWSATLDKTTCPICGMRDGKVYGWEDVGLIPAHFFCRCSPIPVVNDKEWDKRGKEILRRSQGKTRIARDPITNKNITVPATTNWRDWFRQQNPNIQKDIIGKEKYKMWNNNKIKLEQIAPTRNRQGRMKTIKQLKKTVK